MGYTIENHSPKTETSDSPMYIYKKKTITTTHFRTRDWRNLNFLPLFFFIIVRVSEYHNNRQLILCRIIDKIQQSTQSIFFF